MPNQHLDALEAYVRSKYDGYVDVVRLPYRDGSGDYALEFRPTKPTAASVIVDCAEGVYNFSIDNRLVIDGYDFQPDDMDTWARSVVDGVAEYGMIRVRYGPFGIPLRGGYFAGDEVAAFERTHPNGTYRVIRRWDKWVPASSG